MADWKFTFEIQKCYRYDNSLEDFGRISVYAETEEEASVKAYEEIRRAEFCPMESYSLNLLEVNLELQNTI
jgi:hypothetical protein